MKKVTIERRILNENDLLAAQLRSRFAAAGVLCLNLVSSPGSGKTSLLERTLERIADKLPLGVIEGDVQTDNDARRLARFDVPIHQIQTGGACHLDARMINRALEQRFDLSDLKLLFIENVGNLVCPADFPLGTDRRMVLISVTEGDDMIRKHPFIFLSSDVAALNKVDLLPYLDMDADKLEEDLLVIKKEQMLHRVSTKTGEGLDDLITALSL